MLETIAHTLNKNSEHDEDHLLRCASSHEVSLVKCYSYIYDKGCYCQLVFFFFLLLFILSQMLKLKNGF